MSIITYMIADDHMIFRKGLRLALANDHKLKCTGEATDGNDLIQMLQKQEPDIILLDLSMPHLGGKEVLQKIRSQYPKIRVLILTMHNEEEFIIDLMEAGANGYLLKNAEPDEIKTAIHTVYENEFYFSDLVSNALLRKIVHHTKVLMPQTVVRLTDKEIEVLRLICAERTAAEIAKEIYLSPRTVEGIRSSLLEKTGARNTAGLVVYAIKNGIIS